MRAPGIEYRVIVEGQTHFNCERLRATIGVHECARRWHWATLRKHERLVICRRCPTGALHAEPESADANSPACQRPSALDRAPARADLCIRCGRVATRLIWGELCPSCSNREVEWRRGANGRGTAPIQYRPPRPWRVGVVERDGRTGWRRFRGQNFGEALARAVRAGYRLHDGRPGAVVWNASAKRFEYRDAAGRVLLELEVDGRVEFVAVDRLHAGEVPAPVVMSPMLVAPAEAAELLPLWLGDDELAQIGTDWRQVDVGCGSCRAGVLHARRRGGELECRCSAACC